jgi:nitroreductase
MQALKERRSTREFASSELPDQTLADLLWAAFGINRPGTGHRTAPSAMNQQELDIYVGTARGLFVFDAKEGCLRNCSTNDVRALTGGLPGSTNAPLSLIFVADRARMEKSKGPEAESYTAFDAGCVSQNVYLFCASAGLGTVVHEIGDRSRLSQAMGLRADQRIILAQSVGYPKTP